MSNWVTLRNGCRVDLDDPTNPITGTGNFNSYFGKGNSEIGNKANEIANKADTKVTRVVAKSSGKNGNNLIKNQNDVKILDARCESDTLLDYLGSYDKTPEFVERYNEIKNDVEKSGGVIEFTDNPNRMVYNTNGDGTAGTLSIPYGCSIGAIIHEYQHFVQDRASGFTTTMMSRFQNPKKFALEEAEAYSKEYEIAMKYGFKDAAQKIKRQALGRMNKIMEAYSDGTKKFEETDLDW